MPDTLRDLVVSLSLQTDNFTRNIRSVNRQIQEAESYFRMASAGVEGFEHTSIGLSARLDSLHQKLTYQRSAVEQYERALAAANSKLSESYNRYQDYNRRLDEARQKYQEMQAYLQEQKAALQQVGEALGTDSDYYRDLAEDIQRYEIVVNAVGEEVKKLSGQTDALRKSSQNTADAVSTAQTQLNKAKAAVKQTQSEIDKTNKSLKTAQSSWTAVGTACEAAGKRLESSGRMASSIGRTLTTGVSTPIVALGATAVKASLDFESSFASVRKTVDATEEEFAELAAQSKKMSTQVAASTSTINEVMATGGQLGIANEHLQEFTRVMIDLGNSCEDLNADDAATSIAKFANVMKTDQSMFQNIGSTIVDLGNNFATTEKPIMEMAQRLAGAGKLVGLTEPQVLGFATALSSVGIEAQMGGSAFSKALIKMEVAAATGGQALEDFARVSGMTAQEFKSLFESDPAAAFQAFIGGLAKLDDEGESAIAVLDEIGIKEVRLRDTMLRTVNATELVARAQERANTAWEENTALTIEANKRYTTTASKLTNLKNSAMLFAQQLGDDLNPTIRNLISGAGDLIDGLSALDASERQQLMKLAAIAASIGPIILVYGKLNTGLGKAVKAFGTFATAVGKAGGGLSGFISVLSRSPAVWLAVGAAVAYGVYKLYDWASGAKMAREATQSLIETANDWKQTAADTFYGKADSGLSFFGMSEADFSHNRTTEAAKEWLDGLIGIWTDGKKDTDEIVQAWTDSWKALTDSTRTELSELQETAKASGHTGISEQIQKDIDSLDSMDREIESLLKKRQNGYLSDSEKLHLQELIDTREAIIVKYKLEPEGDTAGFDTILENVETAVARARALGKEDADVTVYQNAVVAAAQGIAAMNRELDVQYNKEYAIIQLMEEGEEKESALADLNAKYSEERLNATREYARTLAQVIGPAWNDAGIQKTGDTLDELSQKLTLYDLAVKTYGKDSYEASEALDAVSKSASGLNEGDLTEYTAMLTQVSELLSSGMSLDEVSSLFPDIDLSTALDQLAAIQTFTESYPDALAGLRSMFGEGLGEEVLTIATDLNMDGAQARWDEWAANPGAITTDAIIESVDSQKAKDALTGLTATVLKYMDDPSGTNKDELLSALTAYVSEYTDSPEGTNRADLLNDLVGAVVAYGDGEGSEESKAALLGALSAYVSSYADDPNGTNKSELLEALTATVQSYIEDPKGTNKGDLVSALIATIVEYQEAPGITKPKVEAQLTITGYDMLSYIRWKRANKVEVEGVVRLGSLVENPEDILGEDGAKFYDLNGIEIPVDLVPKEKLTAETIVAYDADGTLHVMITPEVTGTPEAIEESREQLEKDQLGGDTFIGRAAGIAPTTTLDMIDSAIQRIKEAKGEMGHWWSLFYGGDSGIAKGLDNSMQMDFSGTRVAELSTYVAEVVAAIQQGGEVSEEDIENLKKIQEFVEELDSVGVGQNVTEGIAEGMTEAGFDTAASTVAQNLEAAINAALEINSPSKVMVPAGEAASEGVAEGMTAYSFGGAGSAVATNVKSAMGSSLTPSTLRPVGISAMAGLAAGILAGRSGVIAAMREAARAAVDAAKKELLIQSPSKVFRDDVGAMVMKGFGEGVLEESAAQAKIIRNAARYLTDEAQAGAIGYSHSDNRRTYNNNASVNFSGSNFYIREERDIYTLADELAKLKLNQIRALGAT